MYLVVFEYNIPRRRAGAPILIDKNSPSNICNSPFRKVSRKRNGSVLWRGDYGRIRLVFSLRRGLAEYDTSAYTLIDILVG
jgi:hypothetical protein